LKHLTHLLVLIYARLLGLYPRRYRRIYSQERVAVFRLAVHEQSRQGLISLLRFLLREMRDLPLAALAEHRRERRRRAMENNAGTAPNGRPLSWGWILVAVAPFLYFAILLLIMAGSSGGRSLLPYWAEDLAYIGLLVLLLATVVLGLLKGFPRWSLPAIGLALATGAYLADTFILYRLRPILFSQDAPVPLRLLGAWNGEMWLAMLVVVTMIVLLATIWPPMHSFRWRIRQDPSLLPFALYGATVLALAFTFNAYIDEDPSVIIACLLLAAGGVAYLHLGRPQQRLLALFAGLTLAMFLVAVAKAYLFPQPDYPWPRYEFAGPSEALAILILWGQMVMLIFGPALFSLLPYRGEPSLTAA
jgi:hypothetical protein